MMISNLFSFCSIVQQIEGSTRGIIVFNETDLQWRISRQRNFVVVRDESLRAEPFDELDCRGAEPIKMIE